MDKEVFVSRVLPLLTLSVFFMFLGAGIGLLFAPIFLNFMAMIGLLVVEIIILIALYFVRKKFPLNLVLLLLFVLITGITLMPVLAYAVLATGDIFVVVEALSITTVSFALLTGFVYFTGKDFRSIGTILFVLLIGAILASLIGFFVHMGNLFYTALDVFVLLIFFGFVLYDSSRILRDYSNDDYVYATVSLYIDFLNIFIRVLMLLAGRRND
jgi:FtsH-binding integral membrane protein